MVKLCLEPRGNAGNIWRKCHFRPSPGVPYDNRQALDSAQQQAKTRKHQNDGENVSRGTFRHPVQRDCRVTAPMSAATDTKKRQKLAFGQR